MRRVVCPFCGSTNVYKRQGSDYLCGTCLRQFGRRTQVLDGTQKKKLKIFLSYGHVDEEIVLIVRRRLIERGHDVFFDQSDIKFTDDWRERIADYIKACDVVIAFLSKEAFREGGWCRQEVEIANSISKGGVQTVLLEPMEEVHPPAILLRRNLIDMSHWQERKGEGQKLFDVWLNTQMLLLLDALENPGSSSFRKDMDWLSQRLGVIHTNARRAALLSKPFVGREWLMKYVGDWLDDPTSERVCLVTGDAGVGKSAFAAHLSHWESRLSGKVAASVFCERGLDAYNTPHTVICALAYSLAGALPQYRILLREKLQRGVDIGTVDDASLFRLIIGDPLSEAICYDTVCLVIDGLDEAGTVYENALAGIVGCYAGELPSWVKVLITSRRSSVIADSLRVPARIIDMRGRSDENESDMREYLASVLSEFSGERGFKGYLEKIVRASDGAFLYAEYMADVVKKQSVPLHKVAAVAPDGLSGVFLQWYEWTFPSIIEYREEYRDALGIVLAAPSGTIPLSELRFLLGWGEHEERHFLRRLEVFLASEEDLLGGSAVRVGHSFVSEWLASKDAREYRCDVDAVLRLMGERYYEVAARDIHELSDWALAHVLGLLDRTGMRDELASLWVDGRAVDACLALCSTLKHRNCYDNALEIAHELSILSKRLDIGSKERDAKVYVYLGVLLSDTGRMAEAEKPLREALAIRRRLVEAEPAAHLPDLAASLINYGRLLREIGRMGAAEELYREALAIFRRLVEMEPAAHLPDLAGSLANLTVLLHDTGRMAEAEESCREDLAIRRGLVEGEPAAHLREIARSLNILGVLLSDTGRMGLAGDAERLSFEAGRLATEAAKGSVDVCPLLAEVDLLLTMTRPTDGINHKGDAVIVDGKRTAVIAPSPREKYEAVCDVLNGYFQEIGTARLRRASFAKDDVADSIAAYARGIGPDDVLAVAITCRGLFRKHIHGYLCTSEALHSSYLGDSCIPYEEVSRLSLASDGVYITSNEGESAVVDFGEFNEEVFQILQRITDALRNAKKGGR